MKAPLLSLLLITTISVFQAFSQSEEAKPLVISPFPTFGDLTKAGLHFKIPDNLFVSRSNLITPSQREIRLEGEKATVTLQSGTSTSAAITFTSIVCRFTGDQLTPPGETYPPKLPITDNSQAASLELNSTGDPATAFNNAQEFLKVLGIQDPKLNTWIESELWKNSGSFNNSYDLANGIRAALTVGVAQAENTGGFGVSLFRPSPEPESGALPQRRRSIQTVK